MPRPGQVTGAAHPSHTSASRSLSCPGEKWRQPPSKRLGAAVTCRDGTQNKASILLARHWGGRAHRLSVHLVAMAMGHGLGLTGCQEEAPEHAASSHGTRL